jgi:hypothetical protein
LDRVCALKGTLNLVRMNPIVVRNFCNPPLAKSSNWANVP